MPKLRWHSDGEDCASLFLHAAHSRSRSSAIALMGEVYRCGSTWTIFSRLTGNIWAAEEDTESGAKRELMQLTKLELGRVEGE